MLITFNCTSCQQELETGTEAIGTQVECPSCRATLTVPRKELGPGVTIGGFHIDRLLGVGGMGQVYLARQLSLDREVALKILPAQMSLRQESVQRFLNEVKLLARLEHPNIVTAFEAGEDAGVLFLAMAYVRGESLEAKLLRDGPLPEAEALHLSEKVAGALGYAWGKHQLLHRDIKPANILLDVDGEPKLVDLGLAKSLTATVSASMPGVVMGTPNYMSPEQAQGLGDLDCRSDIYSLGITLYHMVSGQVPFASSSMMEILRKQVSEKLTDPRQFNPHVSEPCVALLETMLAKDPTSRYTTWELLIADLERVRHKSPPSQQLQTVGGSMLMRLPKGPGGLIKAPIRATAITVDSVSVGKSPLPWIIGVVTAVVALVGVGLWLMTGSSQKPVPPVTPPPVPVATPVTPPPVPVATPAPAATVTAKPVVDAGQAAFLAAQDAAQTKPGDFDAALARFEQVKQTTAGTSWSEQAEREIFRLTAEKAQAVDKAIAALRADAGKAGASGAFAPAMSKLENYRGAFAAETAAARAELVATLKRKEVEAERARQAAAAAKDPETEARRQATARAALASVLEKAATEVLRLDCPASRQPVATALANPDLQSVASELVAANDLLAQLAALPETVLAGFACEKDKTITVEFQKGGPKQVAVVGITAGKVKARQELAPGQYVEWDFGVAELTTREKLKRLATNQTPAGRLLRGYLSIAAGNWPAAKQEFGQMGPGLGATLTELIQQRSAAQQLAAKEIPAKQALAEMLQVIGLPETQANMAEVIGSKAYTSSQVAKTQALVAEFQKKYGDTVTAQTNAPVLAALAAVSTVKAFKPVPMQEATEGNIRQVIAALRAANPGVNPVSGVSYSINGGGIDLTLGNNNLPRLKLSDISALAGLPLKHLGLIKTDVSDLRPLRGLELNRLDLRDTTVKDLSPLKDMDSLKDLDLGPGELDFTPLQGLNLEHVRIFYSLKVISPVSLRGLHVKMLLFLDAPLVDVAKWLNNLPPPVKLKYWPPSKAILNCVLATTNVTDFAFTDIYQLGEGGLIPIEEVRKNPSLMLPEKTKK